MQGFDPANEILSNELGSLLSDLALACPVRPDNPPDCPLNGIRRLPVAERLDWARSLTPEETEALHSFHLRCKRDFSKED